MLSLKEEPVSEKDPRFPPLPLTRLRLYFELQSGWTQITYAGSLWRGLFGRSLRDAACTEPGGECDGCLLRDACAYGYLFETRPPADAQAFRNYSDIPRPFVIQPLHGPDRYRAGSILVVSVSLFGRGARYAPYVVQALQRGAADRGLGAQHTKAHLVGVKQVSAHGGYTDAWDPQQNRLNLHDADDVFIPHRTPHSVSLRFTTPLRIVQDGKWVTQQSLTARTLARTLLARVSNIQRFHCTDPLPVDFAALLEQSESLSIDTSQLHKVPWKRHSSRQGRELKMDGLLGLLNLEGAAVQRLWPFLYQGQYLHLGKGTVMGLGHYQLSCRANEVLQNG